MSVFHPDSSPHPIHTLHRVGAGAIGAFLLLFAARSLLLPVGFLPGSDAVVFGMATSGALAIASIIVGCLLIAAAVRDGPMASSVSILLGAVFLLSGIGNALVLGTSMNMLGFRLSNVVFSLAVGFALLLVGAYGRFTGSLPADSPYATATTVRDAPPPVDPQLAAALADAERAVAAHTATTIQAAGVAAAAEHGSHVDRSRAFAQATARVRSSGT